MPVLISQLVDQVAGMTTDRVFESVWTDEMHLTWPPADRFIALYAHRFPVDQTDVSGGGELNTAFDAQVKTTAFVRVEADIENRSGQFLTDQVRGVYLFAKEIIEAFQMFDPPAQDSSGVGLNVLRRPMRLVGDWSIQPKSGKENSRWGVIPINWEVSFVADLGKGFDGLPLIPGF